MLRWPRKADIEGQRQQGDSADRCKKETRMAPAREGDTVKVHYTGRLEDGEVFDSSTGREPLEFTIGSGQVIPGFDAGVAGMSPGDSKTITVSAREAYGLRQDDLVFGLTRDQLPPDFEPEVGQQLQLRARDGRVMAATVTGVTPIVINLDANHPLAGEDLTFDLELVEIA
jgi:peptidylprolyl isomerase